MIPFFGPTARTHGWQSESGFPNSDQSAQFEVTGTSYCRNNSRAARTEEVPPPSDVGDHVSPAEFPNPLTRAVEKWICAWHIATMSKSYYYRSLEKMERFWTKSSVPYEVHNLSECTIYFLFRKIPSERNAIGRKIFSLVFWRRKFFIWRSYKIETFPGNQTSTAHPQVP